MSTKVFGLHHVGIMTQSRDDSVKFYTENLGFELVFSADNQDNSGVLLTMLKCGDFFLELVEMIIPDETTHSSALSTKNHIALSCTNIEEIVASLIKNNITFEFKEPKFIAKLGAPPKDVKIIFFRGPSGERIELYEVL